MKYQIVRVPPTEEMKVCMWNVKNFDPDVIYIAGCDASPPAPSVEHLKDTLRWLVDVVNTCVPMKEPTSYAQEAVNKAKLYLAQFEAMEKENAHLS